MNSRGRRICLPEALEMDHCSEDSLWRNWETRLGDPDRYDRLVRISGSRGYALDY